MCIVQVCNECGDPIPIASGALCPGCRKAAKERRLEVGSIGRAIIAKRAAKLMDLVVAAVPDLQAPVQQLPIMASVAADQLAKAWGVRNKFREDK